MENQKISCSQAVILFSLSRVFNVLNFVPFFGESVAPMAMLYGTIFSFIEQAIVVIPFFFLYRRCAGQSMLTLAFNKSRVFGIITTLFFLLFFLVVTIGGVAGFDFFMLNAIYPDATVPTIAITICAVCFFCARNGIQGLARSSVILFVFFALGLICITIVSAKSIKPLNFHAILDNPIKQIFFHTFDTTSKGTELAALLLLMPSIRLISKPKDKGATIASSTAPKAVYGFLGLSFLLTFLINFLIVGILGEFGATQTFPYFTITSVVELKIFQRLDSIHMISWVFISFVHITLFAGTCIELLKSLLPKPARKFSSPALFIITTTVAIFFGYRSDILQRINDQSTILLLLAVFVLPIILLFTTRRKGKSHEKDVTSHCPPAV